MKIETKKMREKERMERRMRKCLFSLILYMAEFIRASYYAGLHKTLTYQYMIIISKNTFIILSTINLNHCKFNVIQFKSFNFLLLNAQLFLLVNYEHWLGLPELL